MLCKVYDNDEKCWWSFDEDDVDEDDDNCDDVDDDDNGDGEVDGDDDDCDGKLGFVQPALVNFGGKVLIFVMVNMIVASLTTINTKAVIAQKRLWRR